MAPLSPPPTPKQGNLGPEAAPTLAPPAPGLDNSPSDRPLIPAKPTSHTEVSNPSDAGTLTVYVPADAKVYVNGVETKSLGSQRKYMSYGLEHGKTYPYTVKALMLVKPEGNAAEEQTPLQQEDARRWNWVSRTVYLKAGEDAVVSFTDDPAVQKSLVEAEAKRAYEKEQRLDEGRLENPQANVVSDGWTASVSR